MKIEIGESLLYSWLHHVKACQIVQTNWKPSPQWAYRNKEKITDFLAKTNEHFKTNLEYDIYKSSSTEQLIKQAEVDVLGISFGCEGMKP